MLHNVEWSCYGSEYYHFIYVMTFGLGHHPTTDELPPVKQPFRYPHPSPRSQPSPPTPPQPSDAPPQPSSEAQAYPSPVARNPGLARQTLTPRRLSAGDELWRLDRSDVTNARHGEEEVFRRGVNTAVHGMCA